MQPSSSSATSRRLGEDFAPQRALYLNHIPALLIVTGLVTWIAADETAMVIAAAVAGLIGVYMVWDWLFQEAPTRFSTLMTIALLLGYGLGTLNTWLTLPRGDLSLSGFLGLDEAILARGMAAVLLAAAPVCFLGELYERPLFGREFRIPLNQQTYTLIYLGAIAVATGFFTHVLGFGGIQNTYGQQQSVLSALLSWFIPPLAALTAAVFVTTPRGWTKIRTGACALVLGALVMLVGRRVIIYTAMEILFGLRLAGYRLKGTISKKLLLIVGCGVFLAIGVNVFMLLRLAAQEGRGANTSLDARIQVAMNWVEDGTAISRALEANRVNAQKRTFVLGFFASVLEGSSRHTPALGQDAAGYISLAIPRLFNPNKDLTFSEEGVDDQLFSLTYFDEANSILTNGATDFGFLGVLVYPLLIVWLMRFSVETCSRFLSAAPMAIIALGVMFSLLQTENSIDAYLVTIRNTIAFAIILLVFSRMPAIRLRSP